MYPGLKELMGTRATGFRLVIKFTASAPPSPMPEVTAGAV